MYKIGDIIFLYVDSESSSSRICSVISDDLESTVAFMIKGKYEDEPDTTDYFYKDGRWKLHLDLNGQSVLLMEGTYIRKKNFIRIISDDSTMFYWTINDVAIKAFFVVERLLKQLLDFDKFGGYDTADENEQWLLINN